MYKKYLYLVFCIGAFQKMEGLHWKGYRRCCEHWHRWFWPGKLKNIINCC